MKRIYNSIKYHLGEFLFNRFAWPSVKRERIAKILLRKYLPANAVIIDCGAHDGADSTELAAVFSKGTVHAFEPVTGLFERLKVRTSPYRNIRCYNIALADRKGTGVFNISTGKSDASGSLLEPREHLKDHPDTFFTEKLTVQLNTLDGWAAENGIGKIDMLWLDMQGFEMKMLEASPEILKNVSVIHTEVSTKETYAGVPHYNEYRVFLESKGFKVKYEAIPAGWDMGNVLFIRDRK